MPTLKHYLVFYLIILILSIGSVVLDSAAHAETLDKELNQLNKAWLGDKVPPKFIDQSDEEDQTAEINYPIDYTYINQNKDLDTNQDTIDIRDRVYIEITADKTWVSSEDAFKTTIEADSWDISPNPIQDMMPQFGLIIGQE